MSVGCIPASNPEHLRRRTAALQDTDEIDVFGENRGTSLSRCLEDFGVLSSEQPETTSGNCRRTKLLFDELSYGWRKLSVDPDDHATRTGWSIEREAYRRDA